uniref:CCHC-type domain-containing protein n=1 Tax=Tanacetum cinerariifolium TaxID=118510 RepID=A0A699HA86_TANCI|nr:hypothetical protein [Tanacetum cinerariifolium]
MFTSNQQSLAESGASDRPPILEKGSYVPWASRFRRFLDNKQEDGERMWSSIETRPYERQMITNLDDPNKAIHEPISKMTEANKKQYFVDINVMIYLLQGIPNIYNSVDASKDAKTMWERIKRLMRGSKKTKQVKHSRLMDEFNTFVAMEGESLTSMYERITTLVNVMDWNEICPLLNFSIHYNLRKENFQCYNCNAKDDNAHDCPKPKVPDARYFNEQKLLTMKDEVGGTFNAEENNLMLDITYGDDTLEELTAAVIMTARIQPADEKVMLSQNMMLTLSVSGTDEHDSNVHDQSFDIESLVYNAKKEAENQQRMNKELKKQKELL